MPGLDFWVPVTIYVGSTTEDEEIMMRDPMNWAVFALMLACTMAMTVSAYALPTGNYPQ